MENFNQKFHKMVQGAFGGDVETPKTQEERQAAWDEAKRKESEKFDPRNVEQGDLF